MIASEENLCPAGPHDPHLPAPGDGYGTTVTSAGLVLAGTFAVFALVGGRGSGRSQIRDIGVGLALGVLMDTFIVRTVVNELQGNVCQH